LICPEASFQVPSMAPATSPPAAKAVVENSIVTMRTRSSARTIFLYFVIKTAFPF